ncbi:ABC transporter substrate-binding protein [Marinivivus vitaminiproducens]|uniref:ABC transporter substrate-binding protein n=1 Tax=Marinivivus vitaminiproducens TaxID=3035935 RepID=UPI00279F24C9|nr:ABC transporter substrate-binding protein [Geminicoccaceae bacterium SCSIO 64248]
MATTIRALMGVASLVGATLASGIGPAEAADAWRHGVVEAKGDSGIIFMPTRFSEKYDIDLTMIEFVSSTVPVKALLAGEIDSYSTTPLVAIAAMSEGASLRFVGCNWPGMTYDLYGQADVKSVEDLRGKSVGVSGPGSAPDLFAREALRAGGVDPSEVTFANAGGGGDRFRAVVAGVVDATATSSEFEQEAEARGINVVARARDATPNFVRNCLVTTEANIESRRDVLVRFLASQMVGHAYAMDHPEETEALARETAHLAPEDTSPRFIFTEAKESNAVTPDFAIPADKLQWNVEMMQRNDRIREAFDINAFIEDGPRQEALVLTETE